MKGGFRRRKLWLIIMSNYFEATNETPKYIGSLFADIEKSDGGLPHASGVSHFQILRANRKHPEYSDGLGYTYNHAPDITYWNGSFWVQYISNKIDEHEPGGVSFISRSEDGTSWSKPIISFPIVLLPKGENICSDGTVVKIPEKEQAVMHQRTAFYIAPNGKLLTTGFYGYSPNHAVPWEKNGLGRVVREIYTDGSFGPIYFIHIMRSSGWQEETLPFPYFMQSSDKGFVEACKSLLSDKFETQQWAEEHGNDCEHVSLKTQNEIFGTANKPYQAFTYYHIDNNTVAALWKHAVVGISKDNGDTWAIKRETSFATSGAKAWGQKIDDHNYAIAYINSLSSEHRYPLVCVTSENGIDFDGMLSIFGETPPRRYDGLFKDFGPQYVRGISETCKNRPNDAMWLTYSVNKEDIWVSRIPLPIKQTSNDYFRGNFENNKYLIPFNTYSSKWAKVENQNESMILSDKDPLDYALAELNFAPCEKIRVEIDLQCEVYPKDLEIELTDISGRVCARLFISNGKLSARYTSVRNELCDFDNDLHKITVEQDCFSCDYTVYLDNRKVGILRNMQKINEVARLIFRTKPARKAPGIDVRPTMSDIPDSDIPTEERIYTIRYISTEKL